MALTLKKSIAKLRENEKTMAAPKKPVHKTRKTRKNKKGGSK